jgi:undecaprenyl-diphosphatase
MRLFRFYFYQEHDVMEQLDQPTDIFHSLHRFMTNLGRNEWRLLLALALIVGGVWLTAAVAEEVVEGDAHTIDRAILLSLREPDDLNDPLGPYWFEGMIRDFTSLGGTAILVLVVTAVGGYLIMLRQYKTLVIVLTAVIGGAILSFFLKDVFDRPRPDLVMQGAFYTNPSFPSGHALLAAATYLTLGSLLARIQTRLRLKAFIILLAVVVAALVGFSRVYLGVHWPSDVLAGWTIGIVWALLCWLGATWLHRNENNGKGESEISD